MFICFHIVIKKLLASKLDIRSSDRVDVLFRLADLEASLCGLTRRTRTCREVAISRSRHRGTTATMGWLQWYVFAFMCSIQVAHHAQFVPFMPCETSVKWHYQDYQGAIHWWLPFSGLFGHNYSCCLTPQCWVGFWWRSLENRELTTFDNIQVIWTFSIQRDFHFVTSSGSYSYCLFPQSLVAYWKSTDSSKFTR